MCLDVGAHRRRALHVGLYFLVSSQDFPVNFNIKGNRYVLVFRGMQSVEPHIALYTSSPAEHFHSDINSTSLESIPPRYSSTVRRISLIISATRYSSTHLYSSVNCGVVNWRKCPSLETERSAPQLSTIPLQSIGAQIL